MRLHTPHLHRSHTRDAALRKLSLVNRVILAGSVAFTGLLTKVAADTFHGKTLHPAGDLPKGSSSHTTHHAKHRSTPSRPLRAPSHVPQAAARTEPATTPSPAAETAQTQQSAPPSQTPQTPEEHHEEPAPTPAPERESAPVGESPPPAQESAPPVQEPAPVVSGGS